MFGVKTQSFFCNFPAKIVNLFTISPYGILQAVLSEPASCGVFRPQHYSLRPPTFYRF